MAKKISKRLFFKNIDMLLPDMQDEMIDAEHEFAILLTESWEAIYRKPAVHAKAIQTAKKLRELRTLLKATRQLPQSIH
jgi:hypothetical protein